MQVKQTITPMPKAAFDYTELFTKEASENLDYNVIVYIDVFSNPQVANLIKKAYDHNDTKVNMALVMCESVSLSAGIQANYDITSNGMNNFLTESLNIIESSLKKDAGMLMRSILEDSFFTKPGMLAAGLPAMVVDGFIISKQFGKPKSGKETISCWSGIKRI